MKYLKLMVIGGMMCQMTFAQEYIPTRADLEAFYKTKTLVVREDNPISEYNLIIEEVIKNEWHVTDFDFISKKEFEELRMKPEYSFLIMMRTTFTNDNTEAVYKFLHVVLGGDYLLVNNMPTICSVPVSYDEVEEESYIYKMRTLLRFIQNHIENINAHPELISGNMYKHYNENIKDIKGKTLYLVQEELAPEVNSIAKIKKVYPYDFKIATREEIEQVIIDKDPNAVFLHKVGSEGTHLVARCYKIIIGAADANFYYFDYHMIDDKKPDGFLEQDFKKLASKE
jgi:hypothetical protein